MDKMKEDKKNLGAEALRGRPKKETGKLICSINLKLTTKDMGIIREKAQKLGMKATQYVREMVLKEKVKCKLSLNPAWHIKKHL